MLISVQNSVQSMPMYKVGNYYQSNKINFRGSETSLVERWVKEGDLNSLTRYLEKESILGRVKLKLVNAILNAAERGFRKMIGERDKSINDFDQQNRTLRSENWKLSKENEDLKQEISELKQTRLDPIIFGSIDRYELSHVADVVKLMDKLMAKRPEYCEDIEKFLLYYEIPEGTDIKDIKLPEELKELKADLYALYEASTAGHFDDDRVKAKKDEYLKSYAPQTKEYYDGFDPVIVLRRGLIPMVLKYSDRNPDLVINKVKNQVAKKMNALYKAFADGKFYYREDEAQYMVDGVKKFQRKFMSGVEAIKNNHKKDIENGTKVEIVKDEKNKYNPWQVVVTKPHHNPEIYNEDAVIKLAPKD